MALSEPRVVEAHELASGDWLLRLVYNPLRSRQLSVPQFSLIDGTGSVGSDTSAIYFIDGTDETLHKNARVLALMEMIPH